MHEENPAALRLDFSSDAVFFPCCAPWSSHTRFFPCRSPPMAPGSACPWPSFPGSASISSSSLSLRAFPNARPAPRAGLWCSAAQLPLLATHAQPLPRTRVPLLLSPTVRGTSPLLARRHGDGRRAPLSWLPASHRARSVPSFPAVTPSWCFLARSSPQLPFVVVASRRPCSDSISSTPAPSRRLLRFASLRPAKFTPAHSRGFLCAAFLLPGLRRARQHVIHVEAASSIPCIMLARSSLTSSICAIMFGYRFHRLSIFLFAMVITTVVPIRASLARQPSRHLYLLGRVLPRSPRCVVVDLLAYCFDTWITLASTRTSHTTILFIEW
jgi:hypothetical protein